MNESNSDRETAPDRRSASARLYDNLANGTHYQKEVDAMRDMGWTESAEKLKIRLAAQSINVH